MENIKCIFCDLESNEILIKENGYLGRKCSSCDLIYISPRPTLNDIVDLYGHDDANISAASHIEASFIKTLYNKHNLKIIKKYINKGKILEIGAGGGYFLNEARKEGFGVYGLEFNKTQAKFIKDELNIPCERVALNNKTFNNEKFDVIYHCDVISHFYDPIAEFKKMKEKLNENGFVIFETGNLGDVSIPYFKYITKFQYPDHLFFFSEKNINILLDQTGFKLIKIYKFSIIPQLIIDKSLRKLFGFINKNKEKNKPQTNYLQKSNKNQLTNGRKSSFKKLLKNIISHIQFLIRYKLGSIVPKKGRPQTIIIIAKKK